MSFYKGKKVVVTGGTGLIGRPLVEMLLEAGAIVTIASLDDPSRAPKGATFKKVDLRELSNCLDLCKDQEIVFQLAGVKGSPAMTAKRPASFLVPTVTFSFNMMEAARRCNVERFLFTSSVGVYSPAEVFYEDDVWKTFPSPNDRFAGWAKRLCELQAEAYKIEYNWDNISIVRPANVYGPFDNFDPNNAMVIPSLINRAMSGESPLSVWGDGSPIRDFIHARDVARGMMLAVEKGISEPINLGSGTGVTIKQIAEIVAANVPNGPVKIEWDITKPKGDAKRLMDMTRANNYGFSPQISIEDGIKETIAWFAKNKEAAGNRYNAFTETHTYQQRNSMDNVALVTGASHGIGAATAKRLAREGYAVCVNYYHSAEKAEAVVRDIKNNGGNAIALRANIGSEQEVLALFEKLDSHFGKVTALVNNAGVNGGVCEVADLTIDTLQTVFETNVFGTTLCSREAINRMKKVGKGAIVNVSSAAAKFGGTNLAHYAASKAAIETFTIGFAREAALCNVRVNAVSPGVIDTDIHKASSVERIEALKKTLPMKRMGAADEVANLIYWLLSDEASYVSGAIVPITGAR